MRTALKWMLATCVVALVAAGLSACGDKGSGGGSGGAASPVGKWTLDVDALVRETIATLPEDQRKTVGDMLGKTMKEQMSKAVIVVEFKSDGTMKTTSSGIPSRPSETAEGTWKLDGTKLSVQTTTKNGKPPEGSEAEVKVGEFKGNTISMKTEDNGPTLTFKRM